jgi:hypothetical protein
MAYVALERHDVESGGEGSSVTPTKEQRAHGDIGSRSRSRVPPGPLTPNARRKSDNATREATKLRLNVG